MILGTTSPIKITSYSKNTIWLFCHGTDNELTQYAFFESASGGRRQQQQKPVRSLGIKFCRNLKSKTWTSDIARQCCLCLALSPPPLVSPACILPLWNMLCPSSTIAWFEMLWSGQVSVKMWAQQSLISFCKNYLISLEYYFIHFVLLRLDISQEQARQWNSLRYNLV